MQSGIYEKLIDGEQDKEALNPEQASLAQKAAGPLLNRINNIQSAKEFLEECTYYIGLKGNHFCS
jgi:hypothetical protein